MTPLLEGQMYFAYVSGVAFILVGAYLSYRRRRVHPLLLLSISALSFSWIESPYDWAMYAQFPPGLPRMPSWWPQRDVGRAPFVGTYRLRLLLCSSGPDRSRTWPMAERKIQLAQANCPP